MKRNRLLQLFETSLNPALESILNNLKRDCWRIKDTGESKTIIT